MVSFHRLPWKRKTSIAIEVGHSLLMSAQSVFDLSHSMAPPRLWVSQTRIFRTATFEVCIAARAAWLDSNAVTAEAVWRSGRSAVLLNCFEDRTLEPCSRCCVPVSKPNVTVECSSASPSPVQQGDELVFVFDEYCNSSRLHLGGKVVLLVEIVDTRGAVVCRLHSDRLDLCSKKDSSPSPAQEPQQSIEEDIPLSFSPLQSRRLSRAGRLASSGRLGALSPIPS
eukprot:m51a1_g4453 hypothetical protein (225) ;mRNA; f:165289-166393